MSGVHIKTHLPRGAEIRKNILFPRKACITATPPNNSRPARFNPDVTSGGRPVVRSAGPVFTLGGLMRPRCFSTSPRRHGTWDQEHAEHLMEIVSADRSFSKPFLQIKSYSG